MNISQDLVSIFLALCLIRSAAAGALIRTCFLYHSSHLPKVSLPTKLVIFSPAFASPEGNLPFCVNTPTQESTARGGETLFWTRRPDNLLILAEQPELQSSVVGVGVLTREGGGDGGPGGSPGFNTNGDIKTCLHFLSFLPATCRMSGSELRQLLRVQPRSPS